MGQAQIRASERSTVSQTVDGTTVTIDYSRPRARGRTELFGKTVTWGEVWTPGANWATTLQVNRDVVLDGHPVPKGKYSVWFVVNPGAWTIVLDPRDKRYHTEHPDSTAGQLRWNTQPGSGEFAEILTWSFPEVRPDGTRLLFAWGTRRVAINATVRPSHPIPIARADAEPYLGTYEWRWADDPSDAAIRMELFYEDGEIRQRYTPFPDWYPRLQGEPMGGRAFPRTARTCTLNSTCWSTTALPVGIERRSPKGRMTTAIGMAKTCWASTRARCFWPNDSKDPGLAW